MAGAAGAGTTPRTSLWPRPPGHSHGSGGRVWKSSLVTLSALLRFEPCCHLPLVCASLTLKRTHTHEIHRMSGRCLGQLLPHCWLPARPHPLRPIRRPPSSHPVQIATAYRNQSYDCIVYPTIDPSNPHKSSSPSSSTSSSSYTSSAMPVALHFWMTFLTDRMKSLG